MELERLKALIDLVARSGIAELDLTEGKDRVRILAAPRPGAPVTPPRAASPHAPLPETAVGRSFEAPPVEPVQEPDGLVRSPMHGVFHNAPSPDAPPYVELGQAVAAGQTLGLLEAMKVFHPLAAQAAGRVEAILVSNGEEVELDQGLLRLAHS